MLNEKVASKREGSWLDGIGEMIKARERGRFPFILKLEQGKKWKSRILYLLPASIH
jgi:hypothetical protein